MKKYKTNKSGWPRTLPIFREAGSSNCANRKRLHFVSTEYCSTLCCFKLLESGSVNACNLVMSFSFACLKVHAFEVQAPSHLRISEDVPHFAKQSACSFPSNFIMARYPCHFYRPSSRCIDMPIDFAR
jgi:hypothetical protein